MALGRADPMEPQMVTRFDLALNLTAAVCCQALSACLASSERAKKKASRAVWRYVESSAGGATLAMLRVRYGHLAWGERLRCTLGLSAPPHRRATRAAGAVGAAEPLSGDGALTPRAVLDAWRSL